MRWSLKVARVFGIDVRIHISFILIIIFGALQWSGFGPSGWLFGAALISLLFLCVTLHELGHSVVAQWYGIPVKEIILLPVGGVAMLGRSPSQPLQELLIAVAGPLVNVVIAFFLALYFVVSTSSTGLDPEMLIRAAQSGPSVNTLLIWLLNANIVLVLFNMIPAFPLDGGRVLRALLGFFVPWSVATNIAASVGQVFAVGLGILGLLGGNIFLVIIAAFIFLAAGATRSDEQIKAVLSTRRIGDAYNRYALTLDEGDRVSRVAEYLLSSYQPDYAVLHRGDLVGVVTRAQVLASLQNSLDDEPVTNIMTRDIPAVDASIPIDQVRQVMDEHSSRLVAVYDRGLFMGIASVEDLNEAMVIIAYEQRRDELRAAAVGLRYPPMPPQTHARPA